MLLPLHQSAHCHKVVSLPASTTHFAKDRALSQGFCSIYSFHLTSAPYVSHCNVCVFCLSKSKSLVSFMLSNASLCYLLASTLLIPNRTHSLVESLMSSNAHISFIISFIMLSSSSLCMNCLVSLLSYSL